MQLKKVIQDTHNLKPEQNDFAVLNQVKSKKKKKHPPNPAQNILS